MSFLAFLTSGCWNGHKNDIFDKRNGVIEENKIFYCY